MELTVRNILTDDAEVITILPSDSLNCLKEKVVEIFGITDFDLIHEGDVLSHQQSLMEMSGNEEILIEPSSELHAKTILNKAGYVHSGKELERCIENGDEKNIIHFIRLEESLFRKAIGHCCAIGFHVAVKSLLSSGRTLSQSDQDYCFRRGCASSNETAHEAISELLKHGLRPEISPLDLACTTGTGKTIEMLIENGICSPLRHLRGECSLSKAISSRNSEAIDTLCRLCPHSCPWSLICASKMGDSCTAEKLLGFGTNPNTYRWGDGPLQLACRSNSLETVKVLLCHGADISVSNREGISPIQEITRRRGDISIENLLYETKKIRRIERQIQER